MATVLMVRNNLVIAMPGRIIRRIGFGAIAGVIHADGSGQGTMALIEAEVIRVLHPPLRGIFVDKPARGGLPWADRVFPSILVLFLALRTHRWYDFA